MIYLTVRMAERLGLIERKSKYHNRKTVVNGITFDSAKESHRYQELLQLERVGQITNLELQPVFVLQSIKRLKIKYKADFRYLSSCGQVVVEDVKSAGTKTAVYRIKKKLLLAQNPNLDFREV